jgi:DNA-binding NtrC family response regulator
MKIREQLELLINGMLDGQILLDEARAEFEKLYIQKALDRYDNHLSKTASALGVHRNTLSKKVSTFHDPIKISRRLLTRRAR